MTPDDSPTTQLHDIVSDYFRRTGAWPDRMVVAQLPNGWKELEINVLGATMRVVAMPGLPEDTAYIMSVDEVKKRLRLDLTIKGIGKP